MAFVRSALLFVGILFLVHRGSCQSGVDGVDPIAATPGPATTTTTGAAGTTVPSSNPTTKVAITTPRTNGGGGTGGVVGAVGGGMGTGGSSKNSIPRVQDQTNQTFATLNQTVGTVTIALANISSDAKDSLDEAVQNISKIVKSATELKLVENGFKGLSTVFKNLLGAADTRMDRSLVTVGNLIKTSIAGIVKLERDNLGKMKLSSDERTAAKNLRSFESSFYKNLTTCLSTFNGSITSEIGTVENALDTILSEGETTMADLAKAGCPSKECSSLLRSAATNVAGWNTVIGAALNKIPNVNEITTCITGQVNLAKVEFVTLTKNVAPPVDLRTVLTNNTDPLEAFIRSALTNFSTAYQKIIKPVTSRINLLRTAVSRNALTDPKTIIQNNFKPITTVDDSTVQLINNLFPRITTLHRRAIVPLLNKDTLIQARIAQAIGKETSPNGTAECDAAIQNITSIKTSFNTSVISCHQALQPTITSLLTQVTSTTNDTLSLFNTQLDAASGLTASAMQAMAKQLQAKLTAGPQLLADVKKSVLVGVNKAYITLEKCVQDAVKVATDELDERNNPVIKSCLVI